MTTDDGILISELMETEIISVRTYTDKEEVAQLFRKYDLLALPVLDKDGLMVGIVTFDDAMDVMVEEATEDITKMAAINPSEKLILIHPLSPTQKQDTHGFSSLCLLPLSQVRSSQNMKTHLLRSRFLYPLSLC